MFCLAIGLWMVGGGCCDFDAKEAIQFAHKLRHKLWAMIGQDRKWKSMEFSDMLQVELCRAQCSHCSMGGYEMAMLTCQIDHHHNHIITMRFGEFTKRFSSSSLSTPNQPMMVAHMTFGPIRGRVFYCKGNLTIKHNTQILARGIQSILNKYNTAEGCIPCKGDPKRKL